MTSSMLLNIRRGDSDFIAQINELVPPSAFEPVILMKGEQNSLPQFVISYKTVLLLQWATLSE
jgi:hypothetical protein